MPKYYNQTRLQESFLKALKGEIKCGINAAQLPVGVVELSAFKFHYAVNVEPNDFLPDSAQMRHIHMWDHLKVNLAKPLLTELEALTAEMLARLISAGTITMGGKVKSSSGTSVFSGNDWIVSTEIQR